MRSVFRKSFVLLVGSVVVSLCLVTGLVVYLLNASYHRYQLGAEETSQNIALSLETFLNAHFQEVDLALQSAAAEFHRMHAQREFSDARFGAYLESLRQRLPNAVAVRGADKDGWVVYGAGTDPAHPQSLLDRDFFLRARAGHQPVFGLPLASGDTGDRVLPIARPLRLPNGDFGGVAYVNTTNARILELLSSIKLGRHGVITLIDVQQRIFVRYPEPQPSSDQEVVTLRASEAISALASNKLSVSFRARSSVDGQQRTVTLRRIGNYPMYLVVGLAREDYLRYWRDEAWTGGVFLLLLFAAALLFCWSFRRYWDAAVQMRTAQTTKHAHDHLATVLAAIPDSLFEMDANGQYLPGPAGMNTNGVLPESGTLTGRNVVDVLPEEAAQMVLSALAEAREKGSSYGTQLRLHGPAGEKWVELSVSRKDSSQGGEPTLIVLSRDVTERKHAQAQIEQLAFSDLLTGLPNRRLFLDRLKQSMATSERSGKTCALLFLDLDQFKAVNDTMGHQFGDLLLVKTGQSLRDLMRRGDTVARLGGDEFVIILEQLSTSIDEAGSLAMAVADKVLSVLNAEYDLYGREYRSTVSVGVTLYRGHEVPMEELLKRADMSMYQAKTAGRNAVRFFDPQTQATIEARLAMEVDLQRAVADEEFILHYQPQIDQSGRCVGVEALLRWQSKKRGLILPTEFIPLAEETGLISPIGHWVLREACVLLKRWQNMPGLSNIVVAVNVSARQFAHPNFAGEVFELVEHYAINPARLKLELTESMLIAKVDEVISRMSELRAIGISFSLDDFGTGFSSLSYLKRLPFAQIKIDRSFALDVLIDTNDAAICHAIIALGSTLGLEVIAEGVETQEQWDFLKVAGCSHAQGYMIGRPMPATDFEQWMEDSLVQ